MESKNEFVSDLTRVIFEGVPKIKNGMQSNDHVAVLDMRLSQMVGERTVEVYKDSKVLQEALLSCGVDRMSAYKLCLMAEVKGFVQLVDTGNRLCQAEISAFVHNAASETGMSRLELMGLLRSVLLSIGSVVDLVDNTSSPGESATESAYVIPTSLYESALKDVQAAIDAAEQKGWQISPDILQKLEPMVAAGIPAAKRLLGYCMVKGLAGECSTEEGVALLQEAAAAFDSKAAAALADYYYEQGLGDSQGDPQGDAQGDKKPVGKAVGNLSGAPASSVQRSGMWSKAFEYYTGFGSLALTPQRKERMVNIYNHAIFNRGLVMRSMALLLAMLLTLFLAPGAEAYAPHYVWGAICMLGCVGIGAVMVLHTRFIPYDDVHYAPVLMFVVWTLFMVVRFFFY